MSSLSGFRRGMDRQKAKEAQKQVPGKTHAELQREQRAKVLRGDGRVHGGNNV